MNSILYGTAGIVTLLAFYKLKNPNKNESNNKKTNNVEENNDINDVKEYAKRCI